MFRTLSASIIRSTKHCSNSHWCMSWVGVITPTQVRASKVGCPLHYSAVATDLGHPYWIYIIPTHGIHQWLLLQLLILLMMDVESVRNM